MPEEKKGSYRSYVLRCWQEKQASPEQPPEWRFTVQDISEAQRQPAFGSFEQLVAFLRSEILGKESVKTTGNLPADYITPAKRCVSDRWCRWRDNVDRF